MIKLSVIQLVRATGVIALLALVTEVTQGGLIIRRDPLLPTAAPLSPPDWLPGSLFLNQAAIGGGDTAFTTAGFTTTRFFDLNGAAAAPMTPGTLTLKGFGFATPGFGTTTPAATLQLTFVYLGANQAVGGGDDVVVGSTEAFTFSDGTIGNSVGWEGAGAYYVNFDTDPSAMIDGLGELFQIIMTPTGGNIRLKTSTFTTPATNQPVANAKLSFSGTFSAIPEPSAFLFGGAVVACLGVTQLVRSTRRR